jgi:hypothetical protein
VPPQASHRPQSTLLGQLDGDDFHKAVDVTGVSGG